MSENLRENVDLGLLTFVDVAQWQDGTWGWQIVRDDGSTPGDIQGHHSTPSEAIEAGIAYLHKRRPQLVREARAHAIQGMAYRQRL